MSTEKVLPLQDKVAFLRKYEEIVKQYEDIKQEVKEALLSGASCDGVSLRKYRSGKTSYCKGVTIDTLKKVFPSTDTRIFAEERLIDFKNLPSYFQDMLNEASLTETSADVYGVVLSK